MLFQQNSLETIFRLWWFNWTVCSGKDGRGGREHVILVISGIHLSPLNHAVLSILPCVLLSTIYV